MKDNDITFFDPGVNKKSNNIQTKLENNITQYKSTIIHYCTIYFTNSIQNSLKIYQFTVCNTRNNIYKALTNAIKPASQFK